MGRKKQRSSTRLGGGPKLSPEDFKWFEMQLKAAGEAEGYPKGLPVTMALHRIRVAEFGFTMDDVNDVKHLLHRKRNGAHYRQGSRPWYTPVRDAPT